VIQYGAQAESNALHNEETMIDLLYLALTLFAFAALIAYVRGCALLGHEDNTDSRGKDER
jgi:hypothetical protein